jgi:D-3-phosphoglycerate dehydrogenase / 2-oxoglutarate reductase
VGVVGYGQIGRRVALMAAALGAKVLVYSRSRREGGDVQWESDLDRLLGAVDILSLHCPLTPETRGLIGERELALLKPGAILINTARGELVDEQALLAALESGRLAAAALDTFAHEPLPHEHPFMTMEKVLLTPHIAAMTEEAMTRMGTMAATQIVEYLEHRVLDRENLVNAAVAATPKRG